MIFLDITSAYDKEIKDCSVQGIFYLSSLILPTTTKVVFASNFVGKIDDWNIEINHNMIFEGFAK